MRKFQIWLMFVALGAAPVLAQQSDNPPLPKPRPELTETAGSGAEELPLPKPRPETAQPMPDQPDETPAESPKPDEPEGELERVYQSACPALLSGRIEGEMLDPVSEGSCGLQSPIRIDALNVNGHKIALPGAPVANCSMATAIADWAEDMDNFARATRGTEIASLATGPGYVCRLRNNAKTGFVSEHGLGNALDIAGITMADGTSVSVLSDWDAEPGEGPGTLLDFGHALGCSMFTTTLGPEANADHEDHFHFDLGCHGQSCTAQICQ